MTGPTRMISPGDTASQIDETIFIMDPGVSDLSPVAEGKLRDVAKTLSLNTGDRLEVRVYSPSKPRNESGAHRLSLARFLAIRAFLVKNGADDKVIDGRPLISDPAELNADRVELYVER
jgi:outer membrane protein OmpA-like peptidoglycan-associated protein